VPDTHRDRPDIALPTARFLKSQNSLLGWAHFVGLEGAPPPKRVVINEFDSLEQAEAYYKSKAWNDLAPQRDKAIKTIRRYAVEAMN
jgi:hypothetical protein